MTSDILAHLMRVHEVLTSKPLPQAIWFIDRDPEYRDLENALPEVRPDPYHVHASLLFGMPVYRWRSSKIRELIFELVDTRKWSLERARQIFPLCQSGIWVQMSNGKHKHIEILPGGGP